MVVLLMVSFKYLSLIFFIFFYFQWMYISWIYPSLLEFIYISPQSLTILFSPFLFVQLDETLGQENKAKVFFGIWSVGADPEEHSLLLSYTINFKYLLITISQIVVCVHVCACVCLSLWKEGAG